MKLNVLGCLILAAFVITAIAFIRRPPPFKEGDIVTPNVLEGEYIKCPWAPPGANEFEESPESEIHQPILFFEGQAGRIETGGGLETYRWLNLFDWWVRVEVREGTFRWCRDGQLKLATK